MARTPPALPADAERLLVVRLSHLGDVVCALPLVHALRRARPACRLGWIVQREFAPLLEVLEGVELFRFDRKGGARAWRDLRTALRAWRPDATLDVQGNAKSAAAAWVSGAPRRLGPARAEWQEPWAAMGATQLAQPSAGPHVVQRAAAVAEAALGEPVELEAHLPLPEPALATGRGLLGELLPDRARPRRLVHPGRAGDARTLPEGTVAATLEGLASAEDLLVITGPAEGEVGDRLRASLGERPGLRHLVAQEGLVELAGLLAAAGEQGLRLLVGDSGPAHLAAAVGLATDVWIGPTDPARTGPWPPVARGDSPHRAHEAPEGDLTRLRADTLVESLLAASY